MVCRRVHLCRATFVVHQSTSQILTAKLHSQDFSSTSRMQPRSWSIVFYSLRKRIDHVLSFCRFTKPCTPVLVGSHLAGPLNLLKNSSCWQSRSKHGRRQSVLDGMTELKSPLHPGQHCHCLPPCIAFGHQLSLIGALLGQLDRALEDPGTGGSLLQV